MEGGEDKIDEDLAAIQKTLETAAGAVAHHTEAEREELYRVRQRMSDYVRRLLPDARKRCQRRVLKKQARKAGAERPAKMLLGTREEEEGKTKTACSIVCEREFHRGQRRVAKGTAQAL